MRRLFGIALSCTVGLLLPLRGLAQSLPAVEISRDTIQGSGASQPDTEVEPHIAVDPNNPSILVAVFQQGRFPDGGSVAPGYATSHDGGQTWSQGDLPLLTVATGGVFPRGTDPVVAFGPDGAVYAQTLVFGGARSAIAVQRSDDGGLTFGAPVLAHDDNDADLFNDKNWLAVDTFAASPFRGRVYAAWDRITASGAPQLLRYSDDRGETWSGLITVSHPNAGTVGALPVVQPDGALTIIYEDYTGIDREVAQTSRNGGLSFAAAVTIDTYQGGSLPDIRSGGLPAAAVDPVSGDLFAVWQDRRFRSDGLRDIVLSRSTNGGTSWSAAQRVNGDAPSSLIDHFTPAVAALNGHVHVAYRTRDISAGLSPFVDMRYITSGDGGLTFTAERLLGDLSDLRFAAQTTSSHCTSPPCYFLGDYMGIAVSTLGVHPVWCRSFENPLAPLSRHQTTWSTRVTGTCGDGISESGEQCDGSDDAACPSACRSDCSCPCTNEVVDPKARLTMTTRREAGTLSVNMVVPFAGYDGEPVSVRLDDDDSLPIVAQSVGSLPPKGRRGVQWEYKIKGTGLKRVTLRDRGTRQPGYFRIEVKASQWFATSAANQDAASTRVTVTIGAQCFTRALTRKRD